MTTEAVLAPGARVVVRDEEWLVQSSVPVATGGYAVRVVGMSEIVRNQDRSFLTALDDITEMRPEDTDLVADNSPQYHRSRLYLESLLQRTPPTDDKVYLGHQAALNDPDGREAHHEGMRSMSIADDARVIYEYLINQVLSSAPGETVTYGVVEKDTGVPIGPSAPGETVTYGVVEKDTGVPIGPKGSYMGEILDVILNKCAVRGLPPLPSIVVQDYGDTSGTKMPGSGYFVDLAGIARGKNPGGWRIDPGIERWIRKPVPAGFDKDTDRWAYRAMIGEHQQAVWAYQDWPRSL